MTTYRVLLGDESQIGYFVYLDLESKKDLRQKKYRSGLVSLVLAADAIKDKFSVSNELKLLSEKWGFEIVFVGFAFKGFDKNNLSISDGLGAMGDDSHREVLHYRDGGFYIGAMFDKELSDAHLKVDAMSIMKEVYVGACDTTERNHSVELLGITRGTFSDSSIVIRCLPETD